LRRKLGLELVEVSLGLVDRVLRRAKLRGNCRQLGREDSLALLRGTDLLLQRGDPRVHALLLVARIVTGRGCDERERGPDERDEQETPSHMALRFA
jgi:hypothetical protein